MISWFDIIILIPLGFALYKGFSKGFIIEIASIIGLLFGIYGAIGFSKYTAAFLKQKVEISESYLPYLAYTLTFTCIVVAVFLMAKMLESVIKIASLGLINKLAGALFGLLKMALIISGVILIINLVDINNQVFNKKTQEKSIAYNPLERCLPTIFPSAKQLFLLNVYKPDSLK